MRAAQRVWAGTNSVSAANARISKMKCILDHSRGHCACFIFALLLLIRTCTST
jgi:hypothetical protein